MAVGDHRSEMRRIRALGGDAVREAATYTAMRDPAGG
jgi:hypothetical protein